VIIFGQSPTVNEIATALNTIPRDLLAYPNGLNEYFIENKIYFSINLTNVKYLIILVKKKN
jgi:hypothetical protein